MWIATSSVSLNKANKLDYLVFYQTILNPRDILNYTITESETFQCQRFYWVIIYRYRSLNLLIISWFQNLLLNYFIHIKFLPT